MAQKGENQTKQKECVKKNKQGQNKEGNKTRTRKNENLSNDNDDGIEPLRPVNRTKTNGTCVIALKSCVLAS